MRGRHVSPSPLSSHFSYQVTGRGSYFLILNLPCLGIFLSSRHPYLPSFQESWREREGQWQERFNQKAQWISFSFLAMPRGTWELSSPTRDGTHVPCTGSVESWPLNHRGSPKAQWMLRERRDCFWLRGLPDCLCKWSAGWASRRALREELGDGRRDIPEQWESTGN